MLAVVIYSPKSGVGFPVHVNICSFRIIALLEKDTFREIVREDICHYHGAIVYSHYEYIVVQHCYY